MQQLRLIIYSSQLNMFREIILPIFRSTRLCVTACGIMHPRCCRPKPYMFRPLCWAIITSHEVQVRRLCSVQTLAMEHTSIKFFNKISSLSYASQCLYILEPNQGYKCVNYIIRWVVLVRISTLIGFNKTLKMYASLETKIKQI